MILVIPATIRPIHPLHKNAKSYSALFFKPLGVVHVYNPNTLEAEAGE